MSDVTIGKLAADDAQRDAIHVAIAPVLAACPLPPGTHVGFLPDGRVGGCKDTIGIVDPFLCRYVQENERFYLFLYPNTVTGMRHHWSHPAFTDPQPAEVNVVDKEASWQWMREFAGQHYSHQDEYYDGTGRNYTAEEVVERAKDFLLYGDKHVQQGSESLRDRTKPDEFWPHFEAITGMKVAEYHRDKVPFSCTC